mgnify:CR=1 FL=1
MLHASCRVEVENRNREFRATPEYLRHIDDVAKWLTSDTPTFGLYLCGSKGNGKSTLARALQSLVQWLKSNEPWRDDIPDLFPRPGFRMINAKEISVLAKAYCSPQMTADRAMYKKLRDSEVLAIDDLGAEPLETLDYGNVITAIPDIVSHRYDNQLCTIATSNLAASEIKGRYGEAFADRFREMMHIINFGNEQSFRNLQQL